MRRIVIFVVFATAALLPSGANAQEHADGSSFRHFGGAAAIGIDGASLEIATPVGRSFQLRAGASCFTSIGIGTSPRIDMDDPWVIHETIPVTAFHSSAGAHLLADWFVTPESPFRISAGVFVRDSSPVLSVSTDGPVPIDEEERMVTGLSVKDGLVTTDAEGIVKADIRTLRIRPYVGIGVGRAASLKRKVGFTFDLGAAFWGTPKVVSYDWSGVPLGGDVKEVNVSQDDLKGADKGILPGGRGVIDTIRSVKLCPYIRAGVSFLIF